MEARGRTWFDERGLVVGGRPLPFYAGALHYGGVPDRWRAALPRLRELGLTLVEAPVPWRVHEPRPGAYAWGDLLDFLDAASAAGLAVALRIGPSAGSDLTCFGLPDHVVSDPDVQARTSRGTPVWLPSPPRAWPVPSYASAAFHARVRGWYGALAEVLAPHLAPDGPVVALAIDHEAQHFYRLGAFDLDYHPDAVAWWREEHAADPPRDASDPSLAAAWVRFKDRALSRALSAFADMLGGLSGLARYHALAPGHHGLSDAPAIQSAIGGPVALTAASSRADFPRLRRRAAVLASPLPLAQVTLGGSAFLPPLDDSPDRERDQLLTLLASGVRGLTLAMALPRDRHYGAALSPDGALHAPWIAPLLSTLSSLSWPSLRLAAPIGVIDMRADARFGIATNVLDPVTPALAEALDLGPAGAAELGTDPHAVASRRWQDALVSALELSQLPYALVPESASLDELARFTAVIAPTTRRVDRALWERLRALAEARRALVIIGPVAPTHDELDALLLDPVPRRAGRLQPASLTDLPALAADLSALIDATDEPWQQWQIERPAGVLVRVHTDASHRARAVFLLSDVDRPLTSTLLTGPAARLRDPFTSESFAIASGRASIPLPPRGVRMLLVD